MQTKIVNDEYVITLKQKLKFNAQGVRSAIGNRYLLIETLPFNKFVVYPEDLQDLIVDLEKVLVEKSNLICSEYTIMLYMRKIKDLNGVEYEQPFDEKIGKLVLERTPRVKIAFPFVVLETFINDLKSFIKSK